MRQIALSYFQKGLLDGRFRQIRILFGSAWLPAAAANQCSL